jgi:hypothetical protein
MSDKDTIAILEAISRLDQRFNSLDARLNTFDLRLSNIENRLASLEHLVRKIERCLDAPVDNLDIEDRLPPRNSKRKQAVI